MREINKGLSRRVIFSCALALVCTGIVSAGSVTAQQQPTLQQQGTPPPVAADESESVSDGTEEASVAVRPRATDPVTILRTARKVFVHSKTVYVKDAEVENALRKRPEFQALGMMITRDEGQADLVIEVERKLFTKRFVFTVVEPRTLIVVASGKARSVIFGDTIAHKVAEKFVRHLGEVRQANAAQTVQKSN
ncbi:MAG TPA: hypothetical protein VGV59_02845 [Pyrinomonadaceae bacterium]|nr:hypothetical protein [Pyrinomonadaceae bacterium]